MKKILLSVLVALLIIIAVYFILLKTKDYKQLQNEKKTVQIVGQAITYISNYYNLNHQFPATNSSWQQTFAKQNNLSYPTLSAEFSSWYHYTNLAYNKPGTKDGIVLEYKLSQKRNFAIGDYHEISRLVGIPFFWEHNVVIGASYQITVTDQNYVNYLSK